MDRTAGVLESAGVARQRQQDVLGRGVGEPAGLASYAMEPVSERAECGGQDVAGEVGH